MQILAVPNWSFGRQSTLTMQFQKIICEVPELTLHYLQGDVDHNRTVTAISGPMPSVQKAILDLCQVAFESIDLARHSGVHPRIGALDVCPFVVCPCQKPGYENELKQEIEDFGQKLAEQFMVPVFLYEKSERGRHESDLPALRRGGFGGLLTRMLRPDFGPALAHPRLGATVLGWRDFLIAFNINFEGEDIETVQKFAKQIRKLRSEGDSRFLGVRALGFPLNSVNKVQLSMNLTLPDLTSIDPIVEWALEQSQTNALQFTETELIGVIREQDLPTATRLLVKPAQVIHAVK